MTKPVIVLGGGGHAAVLIGSLQLAGQEIIGLVDPAREKGDIGSGGIPVLGDDSSVLEYSADDIELVNGIGSLPGQTLRLSLNKKFEDLGYSFFSVIHPSAIVAESAILAAGVQIMAGAVIQERAIIGKNSIVNTRASIDHDCTIGEYCHVSPAATLCGEVTLGNNVHVGAAAVIIQGLAVGGASTVGAGSVVTEGLPEHTIVYPARSCSQSLKDKFYES